jgi:hypothetical protein
MSGTSLWGSILLPSKAVRDLDAGVRVRWLQRVVPPCAEPLKAWNNQHALLPQSRFCRIHPDITGLVIRVQEERSIALILP